MRATLFRALSFAARPSVFAYSLALAVLPASAADFEVRTPKGQFAFQINGTDSPTLTLIRGRTYTFDVQTTPDHPFHIVSPGVDVNDIADGTITYVVPTDAVNYYYNCTSHGDSMRGEIVTVPPPVQADFRVRNPDNGLFAFEINGVNSPTLTLVRGRTYTFDVMTVEGFHPFRIVSPGVDVNDISTGTITYTVPTNAANYYYNCTFHGNDMRGEIVTTPPPEPPTFKILSLSVSSNIVLTSTGTNTWIVNPEFNTNLLTTNWFALAVQTNRFANGTNEVICGRPPGSELFIRLRAQPKTKP